MEAKVRSFLKLTPGERIKSMFEFMEFVAPASSICWGYAQGRAFGRYDGDQECNPAKTYVSQIDENNFPYVSGASLSGIELGDIVVFGTIRQGENGHAAFVVYIPPGFDGSEAAIRNIKVDQVPA